MRQALYRKYRSKSLAEVIGQHHVTNTLANALEQGVISHAYLFTGPRGVGKTSVARILAHSVNKLPYDSESTHFDIIEIDAASNRRIDEIRDLREKVNNAPAAAQYKVYIIDEAHMLTREAFNALLKTLEEPPRHVIFILATTEAHKLPATIVSRTQRFTFKPVSVTETTKHLSAIAQKENIDITPEALELIARHGEGSIRDSLSLLDQAAASGNAIDAELIRQMLGEVSGSALGSLVTAMAGGNLIDVVASLRRIQAQGIEAEVVAKRLAERLRDELLAGSNLIQPKPATKLLGQLLSVPASHDPAALLEVVLLDATLNNLAKHLESKETLAANEPVKVKLTGSSGSAEPPADAALTTASTGRALDDNDWQSVLNVVKSNHSTLYSLVRSARPVFEESSVTLELTFPFHLKRLNDERNKAIMLTIIKDVTGREVDINCRLVTKSSITKNPKTEVMNTSSTLENISNIFGGAEIVD